MSLSPFLRCTGTVAVALSALLLVTGCQKATKAPSPAPADAATLEGDPTAFRSILDHHSRILTLSQPDGIYLAYDADHGHLYKVWRGGVHLSGAVYDTRHGPQPASEGALYLVQESDWQVEALSGPQQGLGPDEGGPSVVYRGHRLSGETPMLRYDVVGDHWRAEIWEKPRAMLDGETVKLTRQFAVQGLPDGYDLRIASLAPEAGGEVSGNGEWQSRDRLRLKNGVTRLTQTLSNPQPIPSFDEPEEGQHPGEALMAGSDCAACHNIDVSTVGPSYRAIASRYEHNAQSVTVLANKIIEGGSGQWGTAPMTPHPSLSIEQAAQMVQYILSLNPGEETAQVEPDEPFEAPESLMPGDRSEVAGVHPAFDLYQARPDGFEPKVGGMDFLPDGRLVVSTWDAEGSVYLVEHYQSGDPAQMKAKRIARGLAEPLGVKVVDGDIYVMQKQELTRLVDDNGDDIIDFYETVANDWSVTSNFHEFAFGLEYERGYFYATLATAVLPGGASGDPQAPDRGSLMAVAKDTGAVEFIATGLRTPNGIGRGVDGELFIADNQGDWLPASKIVEVTSGAWYGSRSVDFEGTAYRDETLPVVWLPQDEIGNSPSEPAALNVGPYQNQMIHGEVTHGGIKRVYAERVNGRLQGAVFRFSQGLEAGVNRLEWAPDGSLIVGGVGNPGNWGHMGKQHYGLQRLVYNGNTAFEMLSVSARANGFVVEFTEAIDADAEVSATNFEIMQWRYQPTAEYGGPKLDLKPLAVSDFALSENRKRAYFELDGLTENRVVYFRIAEPFASASGQRLWSTEAWYTLNALPEESVALP